MNRVIDTKEPGPTQNSLLYVVLFIGLALNVSSCGDKVPPQEKGNQTPLEQKVEDTSPPGLNESPTTEKESAAPFSSKEIEKAIGWIKPYLELNPQDVGHVHLEQAGIAPNGKIIAANIVGGKDSESATGDYKRVLFDIEKKQILFPSLKELKKSGYWRNPIVHVEFSINSDTCYLVSGWRELILEEIETATGNALRAKSNINPDSIKQEISI